MAIRPAAKVSLGPARSADAGALAAISRDSIEHGLAWRWRRASIAHHVEAEDSCAVVARDGEKIVGFAVMAFGFEEREAHLLLLAVVPGQRRVGLGTRLLAWLETLARRGGIRRIHLEVRRTATAARRFYRARGFERLGLLPGYYQGREDAVRLEKRLG